MRDVELIESDVAREIATPITHRKAMESEKYSKMTQAYKNEMKWMK